MAPEQLGSLRNQNHSSNIADLRKQSEEQHEETQQRKPPQQHAAQHPKATNAPNVYPEGTGKGVLQGMNFDDLGPVSNVQMQFARLQLGQSRVFRAQASQRLEQLQSIHKQQEVFSVLLEQARDGKGHKDRSLDDKLKVGLEDVGMDVACNKCSFGISVSREFRKWIEEHGTPEMQRMLAEYMKLLKEGAGGFLSPKGGEARQLLEKLLAAAKSGNPPWTGGDAVTSSMMPYMEDGDWDLLIQKLSARLDQVGTEIQSIMVMLQDFMGQYNSYLQGARQAVAEAIVLQTKVTAGQQG